MKYDFEALKNEMCWLFKYRCPCRTGSCYGLPDIGCPVYRWFKELIQYQENK